MNRCIFYLSHGGKVYRCVLKDCNEPSGRNTFQNAIRSDVNEA